MDNTLELKKLQAAFKRLRIYIFIWAVAVFFVFSQHFNNLSELTSTDILRLFSLLFFLMSIEGIYFKYYWSVKIKYGRNFFVQYLFMKTRLDSVLIWQGKSAVISGVLFALLAVVLLVLSF